MMGRVLFPSRRWCSMHLHYPPPPGGLMAISRRNFIAGSVAGAAMLATRNHSRAASPNDRLNVAVVGAGGRGAADIEGVMDTGAANIVALCDCDDRQATQAVKQFPGAKHYRDWRKMLDAQKDFDAVIVATPDHNHAIVSVAAMQLGKHVY